MIATTRDPWTGTPARSVTIVRSPEEDEEVKKRIAIEAVRHVIERRGFEQVRHMTLDQMVERLTTDPD